MSIRFIAWNCQSGSPDTRLAELAHLAPAIVFLQECRPLEQVPRPSRCVMRLTNARKCIALGSLDPNYRIVKLRSRTNSGSAVLGATVAYHAFYRVEHGHETHPTYHHQRKRSQPWHIDFCFLPAGWARNLAAVEILDGQDWAARSDHLPLQVDVRLPGPPG